MRKNTGVFGVIFVIALFGFTGFAAAEEANGASPADWKADLKADKQAVKAQRQEIKQHAQAAKAEERQLKQQIKTAKTSGDTAMVEQLKGQLKTTHAENLQEKKLDKKELRDTRHEVKQDIKEARQAGHKVPKGRK